MSREFNQIEWDQQVAEDCRQLVQLAKREDLDRWHDLTTAVLIDAHQQGKAMVRARRAGVVCGLQTAKVVLDAMEIEATWQPQTSDGQRVEAGQDLACLSCSARSLLTAERLVLNFLGRLSGVATRAAEYVRRVAGTGARIYDTRKTAPGWRRLEKYAVRCGGGCNHRTGLFDAVLIKDNHLALLAESSDRGLSAGEVVEHARLRLEKMLGERARETIVEIEVDTLEQLEDVLPAGPDIVLLDNMTPGQLAEAVARRDAVNRAVELEASGGVSLESVRAIAESGVDRISVGALTHSAPWLDIGLDWLPTT